MEPVSSLFLLLLITAGSSSVEGLRGLRALRNSLEANGRLLGGEQKTPRETKCKIQLNQPCTSKQSSIKFYLYNRQGQREELDLKHTSSPEYYDPTANLKVIIHGFSSIKFIDNIVQGYLSRGTDSVMVVDWESLAQKPCYFTAKLNTWQVGRCTGEVLSVLRPRGELHLVGFSLGAHVAGHTSAFLAKNHGIRIDRITGLDPALPLYATPLDGRKLDRSDAGFVDVIHTDPGIYGKAEPSGHADFYINGASIQPGCYNASNPPLCSHRRATEVFAESINSEKGFWGVKCSNFFSYISGYCKRLRNPMKLALIGENIDYMSRGIYFVRTSTTPPYALGKRT